MRSRLSPEGLNPKPSTLGSRGFGFRVFLYYQTSFAAVCKITDRAFGVEEYFLGGLGFGKFQARVLGLSAVKLPLGVA